MPGNSGHSGNEMADELARKGVQTPFIGAKLFCGYGPSKLVENLREWESKEKLKNF